MAHTWNQQQQAIFHWFKTSEIAPGVKTQHLVARARAGTGKTTTIVEAINYAPEKRIGLMAFNRDIKIALNNKLQNPNAEANTIHAIGLRFVVQQWGRLEIRYGNDRADDLSDKVCGPTTPDVIKRLVSKLHTKAREMAPYATRPEDIEDIAYQFECEPDYVWHRDGYDLNYVLRMALKAMELAAKVKPLFIDGADMIFLPLRNRWLKAIYDLVVVDEAQDMTLAQLDIALGVCRGRIAVVGDDRQAIYAFRGADSNSIDRLKTQLNAGELGLTTTYRCGRTIVDYAKTLVPDFEAGPNNPDGEISTVALKDLVTSAKVGDFILSRLNAPLVGTAISLLKQGTRAKIAGRDIGKGLTTLVNKLSKGRPPIPTFLERVEDWRQRETAKYLAVKKEAMVEQVNDKADMLIELASEAISVDEVINRINNLFTDDGLGAAGVVTLSTVHKAKGLEADRVFILKDTLYRRGRTVEETNIEYVAVTRAKKQLFWVVEFMPEPVQPEPMTLEVNA